MNQVAEGVRTTHAACRLGDALAVDIPIMRMVRAILDGDVTPEEAGRLLMTRQLTTEHDFVE
jgi:glycerol-3-phosphate dehydrogenase